MIICGLYTTAAQVVSMLLPKHMHREDVLQHLQIHLVIMWTKRTRTSMNKISSFFVLFCILSYSSWRFYIFIDIGNRMTLSGIFEKIAQVISGQGDLKNMKVWRVHFSKITRQNFVIPG